jgi:hypothetical protein
MGKLITLPTFGIQWKVHVRRKIGLDPQEKKCVFFATIFHVRKPLSYLKECPFHPPFLEYLTNEKYW